MDYSIIVLIMTSRITPVSNPRILLVILFVIIFPVLCAFSYKLFGVVIGIIVFLFSLFFCYHIVLYLVRKLTIKIIFSEDRIRFYFNKNNDIIIPWQDITFAGAYKQEKNESAVFVYYEDKDKLFTISKEFTHYKELIDHIKQNSDFKNITLKKSESIEDHLKKLLEE